MDTWPSVAFYSAFGVFVYYQRIYAQAFKGDGWAKILLTALAFAGVLTGFFYLVDYGLTVGWWASRRWASFPCWPGRCAPT